MDGFMHMDKGETKEKETIKIVYSGRENIKSKPCR
jgi:hypothetical protein